MSLIYFRSEMKVVKPTNHKQKKSDSRHKSPFSVHFTCLIWLRKNKNVPKKVNRVLLCYLRCQSDVICKKLNNKSGPRSRLKNVCKIHKSKQNLSQQIVLLVNLHKSSFLDCSVNLMMINLTWVLIKEQLLFLLLVFCT